MNTHHEEAMVNGNIDTSDGNAQNTGPVFCLLLWVSSDYAQPITGQVTKVTCPVIGRAQPELTPSKRQKMGPGADVVFLPRWLKGQVFNIWWVIMHLFVSEETIMS